MENELISIVVPIYKVEAYLERCIDSIRKQTYKQIEIILVEDGSPDNCGKICDAYAKKDVRIQVIHKSNGGLSDARNAGIEIAKGTYIAFIDADDYVMPNYIENLYQLCKNYQAEIAICHYQKVYSLEPEVLSSKPNVQVYTGKELLYQMYNPKTEIEVVAWNKLYLKSLWEGVIYPKGRIHEDEATTYQLLYKTQKVVVTDEILYAYYQTPNSITKKAYTKKRLDILTALKERLTFFKEREEEDLYRLTYIKYSHELIKAYANVKKYIGEKTLEKQLLTEFREVSKKILDNEKMGKKVKLKLKLASRFPNLCARYLLKKEE